MGSYGEDLKESFSAGMAGAANAATATREGAFGTYEAAKNLGPTALGIGALALAATPEGSAGEINLGNAVDLLDVGIPYFLGVAAAAATRRLPAKGWTRRIVTTGVVAAGAAASTLFEGQPITGALSAYAGNAMQRRVTDRKRC